MKGEDILKRVDPGAGLTLDQLIDAFISDPKEAKKFKTYIVQNATEQKKLAEEGE
jgi:hypothetical protein